MDDPHRESDLSAARQRRDAATSALQRFRDDVLRSSAEASRTRNRWLRQRAEEEIGLAGVLRGMSELMADVVVTTRNGVVHRGRVSAVCRDFVVMSTGAHPTLLVVTDAITTLRTAPGAAAPPMADPGGHRRRHPPREHAYAVSLAEVLSGMAGDRPDVLISAIGEEGGIAGRLTSAGHDLIGIRPFTDETMAVYIAISALMTVALTL